MQQCYVNCDGDFDTMYIRNAYSNDGGTSITLGQWHEVGASQGTDDFLLKSNSSAQTMGTTTLVTKLNADLIDGLHSSQQRLLGNALSVGDTTSVAIGYNATSNLNSMALGRQAEATGQGSLAAGREAVAESSYSVAIGYQTYAAAEGAVSIGRNTDAVGTNSVAIGYGA